MNTVLRHVCWWWSWQQQSHFTTCSLHVEHHCRITAGLFIGAGCQNNTSVSACLPACLPACLSVCKHTCMLPSQDGESLHGKDIQLVWKLPSNNNTHTHKDTHTRTHTHLQCAPIQWAVVADCTQTPLRFTSDSFCWSLNTSFPFGLCLSPLSLRLLMIGTSMSSACIFLGRLTSSSAGSAYRSGGELRLHRTNRSTGSGAPSWRSPPPPPPPPPAAAATPPSSLFSSLSLRAPRGRG